MKLAHSYLSASALGLLLTATGCTADLPGYETDNGANVILASIENPTASRTAVDGDPADGVVGLLWTDGDELGVFDKNGANHTRYTKKAGDNAAQAEFVAEGNGIEPVYAYYPYSANNSGQTATNVLGTLPAEQNVGTGNVPGDYKIGRHQGGNKFVFTHIFSLVCLDLDAAGTVLEGEPLEYVKFTAPTNIAGDFNFNLRSVTYSNVTNGSKTITVKWPEGTTLSKSLSEYFSVMPTVTSGSELEFEVKTANYTVKFTAPSKVTFAKEQLYNFPLNLLNISQNYTVTVTDKDGKEVNLAKGDEPTDPEVVTTTGTFTCASMNVDGLPVKISGITINGDGPGSDGTKTISQAIAAADWDFFGVSEDFEYNSELLSGLSAYNHGTYRGSVDLGTLFGTADTDGLNFFWKKNIKAENETMVAYNDKKGDLTHGADEKIKKGFRHYEVTVAEGVVIDVYITHMNTYDGDGNTESNAYVKAVLSQLRQVRDYIVAQAKKNNRPAIFMGDTNMRYTRHDIKTNLIDALSGQNITFNDPWVDFHRWGKFPAWDSSSLMIRSKYEGNTADIVCADDQRGEVVDKIWYFNVPGAPLQLEATNLYNDVSSNFVKNTENASYTGVTAEDENGNIQSNQNVSYTRNIGIADHFPVVADFKWTLTTTSAK